MCLFFNPLYCSELTFVRPWPNQVTSTGVLISYAKIKFQEQSNFINLVFIKFESKVQSFDLSRAQFLLKKLRRAVLLVFFKMKIQVRPVFMLCFWKGKGIVDIFFLNGTLWGNFNFLLGAFHGHQGNEGHRGNRIRCLQCLCKVSGLHVTKL